MVEITVLMPVYNGLIYLEETLASLKQQSFEDFEVLCIDDGSSDGSSEILSSYSAKDARFLHISTPNNLGSAAKAINYARDQAKGRFFVYTSQDDLFSPDWLCSMHERAVSSGADAVVPDVEFYTSSDISGRRLSGYFGDRSAVISGRDAVAASLNWSIPGNALWPISFLKEFGFADFGSFADEFTVRNFYLNCDKVAFCSGVFYYRQDNTQAITKAASAGRLDEADTNLRVWRLIKDYDFPDDVHGPFAFRCLRSLIRMRGILYNSPSLASEVPRIEALWGTLQNHNFQSSLSLGLISVRPPLRRVVYSKAGRSIFWFKLLARASAAAARLRGKA